MDRGQWDKSSGTTFKVIQGQGQGHGGVKVAKMAIFKLYLLRHLWAEVGFDYGLWIYGIIFKSDRAEFLNYGFVIDLWEVNVKSPKTPFRAKYSQMAISHERKDLESS